jgi:hypothetical protein
MGSSAAAANTAIVQLAYPDDQCTKQENPKCRAYSGILVSALAIAGQEMSQSKIGSR